jgi:hypothetical protein
MQSPFVTGANRSIGGGPVPEARQDFSGFVIDVGDNQQYSSRLFRCFID